MFIDYNAIQATILKIISTKTGIKDPALLSRTNLNMLGLDTLDLVEVIHDLEKRYNIEIPDEVQLNTADDFVNYLCMKAI